jgi:hypothetical protein
MRAGDGAWFETAAFGTLGVVATVLEFDSQHAEGVTESLDEVAEALRDASGRTPPLARLTRTSGEVPVLVNASLVRAIWERKPGSARVSTL